MRLVKVKTKATFYDHLAALYLKSLWRRLAGLPEHEPKKVEPLEELQKTEWSPRFERLMRAGLLMGRFRYGKLNDPAKAQWNRLERIFKEVDKYLLDGNDERMVTIANMALLEFEEGCHPKKHYKAEDDGLHTKEVYMTSYQAASVGEEAYKNGASTRENPFSVTSQFYQHWGWGYEKARRKAKEAACLSRQ